MRPSDRPERSPAGSLFDELVATLGEMPGVALGRRYGCWCIKLRRYPFIALDGDRIAFRIGLEAPTFLGQFTQARLWNPQNGRQPKQSWVAHPAGNPEPIATLGAMAYERAIKAAGRQMGDAAAE